MESGDVKFFLRKRYLVTTLTFFGSMLLSFMRTNWNTSLHILEPFRWSPGEEFLILNAYWLGFMTAPLGAVGVRKYGGVVTFGAAVGLAGLLSCFTPILIYWHVSVVIVARIFEGFSQGVCACTFIEVIRLWSIPTERNRLIVGAFSGAALVYLLSFLLFKYPYNSSSDWKVLYYVTGLLSLLWCIIWFILVKNSPEEDRKIMTKEKNYIKQRNIDIRSEREVKFTWSVTLKSKPVWAYLTERFVLSFTTSIIAGFLPHFVSETFERTLPYRFFGSIIVFCFPIGLLVGSILADDIRNYNKLSVCSVHKLFLSLGQIIVIILTIIIAVFSHGPWANMSFVMVIYAIINLIFACHSVAYTVLPVDMGGQYASLISGFGCTIVGFSQILVRLVLMTLSVSYNPMVKWIILFLGSSILNFWGAIIFYKFGSGELQPWAVPLESTRRVPKVGSHFSYLPPQ